jgi:hypothetical protein
MSKTYEDQVLEKLDEIIEHLEAIRENTTPVINIPSIWVNDYPQGDGTVNGWWSISDGQEAWVDPNKQPEACSAVADDKGQYSPNPNCGCSRCNSTNAAGGCKGCGCRNVAIYDQDGYWWCGRCSKERAK